jgi:hypothetical protein
MGKKKILYKTVSIYYVNEKDEKKQFGGKFLAHEAFPTIEL